MSQVRTFIEMDSHEERVYVAVRQTQEREAKQKMREKAKELSKLQRTQQLSKPSIPFNVPMNETKEPPAAFAERSAPVSSSAPVRPKVGCGLLKIVVLFTNVVINCV